MRNPIFSFRNAQWEYYRKLAYLGHHVYEPTSKRLAQPTSISSKGMNRIGKLSILGILIFCRLINAMVVHLDELSEDFERTDVHIYGTHTVLKLTF